ncbi:MAG: hypothetical protein HFI15_16370 [Lachnospiraceae bacterium]|nr:hypothetical protein [Lachnospiraceae bacterium]
MARVPPSFSFVTVTIIPHLLLKARKIPLQQKVFFYMALFGGFRPGELIALTWEDIDSKGNAVSISKSTSKTKEEMITKPPKTKSSIHIASSRNHESVKALENRAAGLPPVCRNVLVAVSIGGLFAKNA